MPCSVSIPDLASDGIGRVYSMFLNGDGKRRSKVQTTNNNNKWSLGRRRGGGFLDSAALKQQLLRPLASRQLHFPLHHSNSAYLTFIGGFGEEFRVL